MSTTIILLDQNFNANDVHIMVFEPSICRKTQKKLKGGPFGENFFPKKKSRNVEKN